MPVDVQRVSATPTPAAADIRRWALAALERAPRADGGPAGAAPAEVCVRVVDETEMRQLNRDYRHQDRPTNVLSFPAAIDLPDAVVWGDVVVCAPVVAAEAEVQNKAYADHFAHMVVHGVLHLLGYDHETDAEASAMEELERGILDCFGVSDPYGEG